MGRLRVFFPNVPILALSATMTQNVLEYIRESLHLQAPVYLYKRTLDRPNITYMVQEITQKGFGDLGMLVPQIGGVASILKTMLFVDSIDDGVAIASYLQSLLPASMSKKATEIVRQFSSNLEASTREIFMHDFDSGNTRILVCTDAAGMGVNLQDVVRAIQWKILEHLTLAALLQRIGRAGRDQAMPAVAIVFIDSKHILPEDISETEDSLFREYTTAIGPQDGARAAEIISTLYENNFQHKRMKSESPYHAVDPAVLWFINTVGCRRCLALACFMSKGSTVEHVHCCDNCIYSQRTDEDEEIPIFERHDVTARNCRRYLGTNEYQLQESQRKELAKRTRRAKTSVEHREICRAGLDSLARAMWPKGMDKSMFPSALRQKIANAASRITFVEDLRNVLSPAHILEEGSLMEHADSIVAIASSTDPALLESDNEDTTPADNNGNPQERGRVRERGRERGRRRATERDRGTTGRSRGSRGVEVESGLNAPGGQLMDWTVTGSSNVDADTTVSQRQTSMNRSEARRRMQATRPARGESSRGTEW